MTILQSATDVARRQLTLSTHRIYTLPIVVLMPHAGCNCRCVMCDIWQANRERKLLSRDDLAPHLASFRRLGVRRIVLSGGEALLHPNLWLLCDLFAELPVAVTLLSTGLLLRRHAPEIVRHCDEVIVSLDGPEAIHDQIRGIPGAFARLADGVAALKASDPNFRVTARCVVQRDNYRALPTIVATARRIGLDRISFLAADVSSTAFNRPVPWSEERVAGIALSREEATELGQIVDALIADQAEDFQRGFIAESPARLRQIVGYYRARAGDGDFPPIRCNAPWVSTVVEADGTVRPCFFHRPLGNLGEAPLAEILNAPAAVAFRRNLDVANDPICRQCVCTLNLSPRAVP